MAWRRGQAYGQDLRERVAAATSLSLRAAAARFAVSPSYVAKVRARLRRTGGATPGPQRNHVPPRLAPLEDALRARVAGGADATLAELRAWALAEHGVRVSQPVVWKTLARLGLTLKKTAARGGAGPRRRGRGAARLGDAAPKLDPAKLVPAGCRCGAWADIVAKSVDWLQRRRGRASLFGEARAGRLAARGPCSSAARVVRTRVYERR